MKLFLKNLLFFVCIVFGTALLTQIAISLRIKGKSVRGHDNLYLTSNVNADLVFLGSSRCTVHFNPHFYDTAFKLKSVNIGVEGHSEISMAIVRLKDYLSRNQPPKFAIFSFDPFMHAGSETNDSNLVHKNDFARYAFFPNKKDLLIVNYFKFNVFEKYVPLYALFKYKLLSDCLSMTNNGSYVIYGYTRHDEKWDTVSDPITDQMKTYYFTKEMIPSVTDALSKLNQLCVENNIKLLCIQTPFYKNMQVDSTFSYTDSICKTLAIPFIDMNAPSIRNNINYFYNPDHLNTYGLAQMDSLLKNNKILVSFLDH